MGDCLVEIMDIHVHLAGVLVIFHGFVFLAYLLGHLALANEGAQVIVVRLDPGADAVLDRLIIFRRVSHSTGAEKSDLLAA